MSTVWLGNDNPMMQGPQGSYPAPHLTQSVTRIEMRPGFDDPENVRLSLSTDNDRRLVALSSMVDKAHQHYLIGLHEVEQLLDYHSGGIKPAWVYSDDTDLMAALVAYYQCAVGEPQMLLTNAGRDAIHAQILTTATQPVAFNYMALTASTTAPATTDTVLTGEITTAGGGLVRAQATYAHTAGTNTSTLTKTFTANGSDVLPVTIAQIGIFNASSVGTLCFHTALSGTATLSVVGDNVTITETMTAG